MKATEQYFAEDVVTIQIKSTQQGFLVVLFIILFKVVQSGSSF